MLEKLIEITTQYMLPFLIFLVIFFIGYVVGMLIGIRVCLENNDNKNKDILDK